ncbi:MAG: hypothetical protein ABEK59_05185 [Halobacteria archaeon]
MNDEKISIGLRGWRFNPDDVFDADGNLKSPEEIPEDQRERIARLPDIIGNACHVCMLLNPDEGWDEWTKATVVYGEPRHEVLTCDDHEPVFETWFFDEGGEALKGSDNLADTFHAWIKENINEIQP